jgi:hypothetical protein
MSDLYHNLYNATDVIYYGQTETLALLSVSESAYLLHLDTKKVTCIDGFYGDPTCGLISLDSKWAVIGGEHLVVWNQGKLSEIPLKWIFAFRQTDTDKIHILTDPWEITSAVWELDITTLELRQIRPFMDYLEQPYTNQVIW